MWIHQISFEVSEILSPPAMRLEGMCYLDFFFLVVWFGLVWLSFCFFEFLRLVATPFVNQSGLELTQDLPASPVLGLKS